MQPTPQLMLQAVESWQLFDDAELARWLARFEREHEAAGAELKDVVARKARHRAAIFAITREQQRRQDRAGTKETP